MWKYRSFAPCKMLKVGDIVCFPPESIRIVDIMDGRKGERADVYCNVDSEERPLITFEGIYSLYPPYIIPGLCRGCRYTTKIEIHVRI